MAAVLLTSRIPALYHQNLTNGQGISCWWSSIPNGERIPMVVCFSWESISSLMVCVQRTTDNKILWMLLLLAELCFLSDDSSWLITTLQRLIVEEPWVNILSSDKTCGIIDPLVDGHQFWSASQSCNLLRLCDQQVAHPTPLKVVVVPHHPWKHIDLSIDVLQIPSHWLVIPSPTQLIEPLLRKTRPFGQLPLRYTIDFSLIKQHWS